MPSVAAPLLQDNGGANACSDAMRRDKKRDEPMMAVDFCIVTVIEFNPMNYSIMNLSLHAMFTKL